LLSSDLFGFSSVPQSCSIPLHTLRLQCSAQSLRWNSPKNYRFLVFLGTGQHPALLLSPAVGAQPPVETGGEGTAGVPPRGLGVLTTCPARPTLPSALATAGRSATAQPRVFFSSPPSFFSRCIFFFFF
jgi:hypothetical protein